MSATSKSKRVSVRKHTNPDKIFAAAGVSVKRIPIQTENIRLAFGEWVGIGNFVREQEVRIDDVRVGSIFEATVHDDENDISYTFQLSPRYILPHGMVVSNLPARTQFFDYPADIRDLIGAAVRRANSARDFMRGGVAS